MPIDPMDRRAWLQRLNQARGTDKLDLLLSAPDPVAFIQSIPEVDLYLAILDVGVEDAAEVVALASPEQFQHFLDLACWPRRDAGPSSRQVLRWLRLAREGAGNSDAAEERYRAKLNTLDRELLSLTLGHEVRVHDLHEDEEPQIADGGSVYRTPDNAYLVEIVADGAGYAALKHLLDDLVSQDPLGTSRLLESLRWDLPTELEEICRRFRTGRLRDLGFPDLDEALAFTARPARKQSRPARLGADPGAGGALAAAAPREPLLDLALPLLQGEDRDRAEEGVVYAANAALVAAGVTFDDAREVRSQLQDARATLSLGLEVLSDGTAPGAAEVLAARSSREIFQAAMGELYRLQGLARAAAASARVPQAQSATLLDPPLDEVVQQLAAVRPRFVDPERKGKARALMSLAEVARAEALLEEAAAVGPLLAALGVPLEQIGAAADAAGLGAATLRASLVVAALVDSRLRGDAFTLTDPGAPAQGEGKTARRAGFHALLETLLARAVEVSAARPGAERAAARISNLLA